MDNPQESPVDYMLYTLELYKTKDGKHEAAFYDHTNNGLVRTFEIPPHMIAQIPGYLRMMETMGNMT